MLRTYDELVKRLEEIARHPSIRIEKLGDFMAGGRQYPMFLLYMGEPSQEKLGVTISAGIHGDEPASVEAVIQFMAENRDNEKLLSRFYFTIFPCDNPSGWELGTRENAEGIDLNREFGNRHPAPEVALIMQALQGRCFDIVYEMHEDIDSPGFYLYELAENSRDEVGQEIVKSVAALGYPVNLESCIEGLPAEGGLIRPGRSRKRFRKTHLPKAVYTYKTCGGHILTPEPPVSVLPIEDRVKIELIGLSIVLESAMNGKDA